MGKMGFGIRFAPSERRAAGAPAFRLASMNRSVPPTPLPRPPAPPPCADCSRVRAPAVFIHYDRTPADFTL